MHLLTPAFPCSWQKETSEKVLAPTVVQVLMERPFKIARRVKNTDAYKAAMCVRARLRVGGGGRKRALGVTRRRWGRAGS